jgi:hypothetical protein
MDVLYYIGDGSSHHNLELRLSLRTLERHFNADKLWIVGNRPEFLQNVEYLWVEDKGKWYQNAVTKTVAAIKAGISDKFLLMNDDFFLTKDLDENYPYYHRGDIPETPVNDYQKIVVNTRKYLESIGKPYKHYGVHCPIIIEKDKYMSLSDLFGQPYSIRCLYGNMFCKGTLTKDNKGDKFQDSKQGCFSSKPWAKDTLKEIEKIYDQPSKWERRDV